MESQIVSIQKLDFSALEPGTTPCWDALQGQIEKEGSEMRSQIVSIPKLDFSALEPGTTTGLEPGTTAGWDALQGQIESEGPKMGSQIVSIPRLDFSALEPGITTGWDALQGQVMNALEAYGCFEVVYDKVTPELRNALFGRAMPELFDLPLEIKMLNTSDVPFGGYVGHIPGMAYESLRFLYDDAGEFTQKLWPQGNPTFYDTVSTYKTHLKFLEQTIVRMIFHGLGIEKHYDSYIESAFYGVRLAEYGIPLDQEQKIALGEHYDQSLVTIVCQYQVGGLEIHTDGEWIPVMPSHNSFTFIIGEALQVWTNGRLQSPLHRVRILANKKRYSVSFASIPIGDCIIRVPKELVDEEHQLMYKPYNYMEHQLFRHSEQGAGPRTTVDDFCGIKGGSANKSI